MKILIVDDHGLVREGLQAVLARSDLQAECVHAWDAASIWQRLSSEDDLSLVLLDISLPDANGIDLLERIADEYPSLPVIILSADHDTATVNRALDAGASGFLPKSSLNQILVSAIHLVLAGGVYVPPEAIRPVPASVRALESNEQPPATPRPDGRGPLPILMELGLTPRQIDIFRLLVQGLSNKEICRRAQLAEPTVKIHVRAILRALNVQSRAQVIAKAGQLGLGMPEFPAEPGLVGQLALQGNREST